MVTTTRTTGLVTGCVGSWPKSLWESIWQQACVAMLPQTPCICRQQSRSIRLIFAVAAHASVGTIIATMIHRAAMLLKRRT